MTPSPLVPFYDDAALIRADRAAIDAALGRVLDAGSPDWGPEGPAFEADLAGWCGAAHAVAVASGTQALVLALRALGIGPGHVVATVANTDSPTPSAIRQVGARPVFVDIEPKTRCMDPEALAACLASPVGTEVRAVLTVDMHGHPADADRIRPLARERGIPMISDACISLGAEDRGRKVGTLADVTCVSFGGSKLLPTVGTGGACLTDDPATGRRMRMLAGYGQDRMNRAPADWRYELDAMNVRMGELQAAILRTRLPRLDGWLSCRRAQARQYAEGLAGLPLDLPEARAGTLPAWRNYTIGCDDPMGLAEALLARGIVTRRLYAPPMHHEPGYSTIARASDLARTEAAARRLLCLPIGPHLTTAQIAQVVTALSQILS